MGSSESKYGLKIKTNSIIKDYIIKEEVVGRGICGNILSCIKKEDKIEEKYALKILYYSNYNQKMAAKKEIELQWRAYNRNKSSNIVRIEDVYKANIDGHKAYLVVMEYVEHKLLDHLAKKNYETERAIAFLMNQLSNAVNEMHSQYISHKHLTLDNILIEPNGSYGTLKVTHFKGAVDLQKEIKINDSKSRAELINTFAEHHFRDDIYALGVIMYSLCCGKIPKTYDDIDLEDCKDLTDDARKLLAGMLDTEHRRYLIKDVRDSPWIKKCSDTPLTPIQLFDVWSNKEKLYIQNDEVLDKTRIVSNVRIKKLSTANNALLRRRYEKENMKNFNPRLLQTQDSKISKRSLRFLNLDRN